MARRPLALVALLAGATAPVLLLGPPAAAVPPPEDAATGTLTVGLASDAWYSTTPACTAAPTGCVPADAPTAYPAKTLHAGVAAGQEESRTYLSLNLSALPGTTSLTGGTLRVPVSPAEDGSFMPESAKLQACLVTAAWKDDVEGATAAPPAVDCKRASAPVSFVAATAATLQTLTVDLGAFATAWSGGAANHGVALLPADDVAPTDTWHVAASAHDRAGSPATKPSATVTFSAASAVTGTPSDAGASFDSAPAPAAPVDRSLGSSSVSFGAPPVAPASTPELAAPVAPAAVAPQTAQQPAAAQLQPQAFGLPTGRFAYPGVFLLPLLLAAAAGWLGRALTRDLTPPAT